jgi:hypothetical protein
MLNKEGASSKIDRHGPRELLNLSEIAKTKEIHEQEIDEVVRGQFATSVSPLGVE